MEQVVRPETMEKNKRKEYYDKELNLGMCYDRGDNAV